MDFAEIMATIAGIITSLGVIFAFLAGVCKPFRAWITGKKNKEKEDKAKTEKQDKIDRYLLRSRIVDVYYRYKDEKCWPQYLYEEISQLVDMYHELGGNSFVTKIWSEMQTWATTRDD